jgi:hypothetical protein
LENLVWIAIGIFTAISAWITGVRMRRRIRRALGKTATDAELVSLNTWMQVHKAEETPPQKASFIEAGERRLHGIRRPTSGK